MSLDQCNGNWSSGTLVRSMLRSLLKRLKYAEVHAYVVSRILFAPLFSHLQHVIFLNIGLSPELSLLSTVITGARLMLPCMFICWDWCIENLRWDIWYHYFSWVCCWMSEFFFWVLNLINLTTAMRNYFAILNPKTGYMPYLPTSHALQYTVPSERHTRLWCCGVGRRSNIRDWEIVCLRHGTLEQSIRSCKQSASRCWDLAWPNWRYACP
jgi:hypothetical protein